MKDVIREITVSIIPTIIIIGDIAVWSVVVDDYCKAKDRGYLQRYKDTDFYQFSKIWVKVHVVIAVCLLIWAWLL